MSGYPYASGDLMGRPQSYFYTPFGGAGFLAAWRDSRDAALSALPAPSDQAPTVDFQADGTASLLERAFAEACAAPRAKAPLPAHVEMFLRKYEVGKRIYDAYDERLTPLDRQQYRRHRLYVRAGEVFETSYSRTGDLRALNVLLKCLDTLIAHASELDAELGSRLARLIAAEQVHVADLAAAGSIRV